MKSYIKLLTILVQVTIFVIGAFDSFLTKMAPPSAVGAFYPIGIMSFFMLILLLVVSVLSDREDGRTAWRSWLVAGIVLFLLAVPAAFVYPALLGRYTYPAATALRDRKVSASDEFLTPLAAQVKRTSNPKPSNEELEQSFPDGAALWRPEGLARARLLLLAGYAWLVLSLSGAIFCLLEARLRKDRRAGQPDSAKAARSRLKPPLGAEGGA